MVWLAAAAFMGWKIWSETSPLEGLGLHGPPLMVQAFPTASLLVASAWIWATKRFTSWVAALSMLLALFVTMIVSVSGEMAEATQNVTDAKQYQRTLNGYWKSSAPELVSHFPKSIPPEASEVHFLFTPKFLMGGARLYLHYQTSGDEIRRLREIASKSRTSSIGLDGHVAGAPNINHFPLPLYLPRFSTGAELPEDFECCYFDPIPSTILGQEWIWNHGQTHGMAFSEKRNEVIFWAEFW